MQALGQYIMTTIYFDDRPLIIKKRIANLEKADEQKQQHKIYADPDDEAIRRLMQEMMTNKALTATIYSSNPDQTMSQIEANFTKILAAGGLVIAAPDQMMLIFRKGKWDLPKGKLDDGETLEACAVREIEEETGVRQLELKGFLHKTFHTYTEKARGMLKETHWYHLTTHPQPLQAQTDEGIDQCIWVDDRNLANFTRNMHQSVKDVLTKAASSGIISAF